MARIAWDSNLFIYLFEENAEMGPRVRDLRKRMLVQGHELWASTFTLGEILVKPLEKKDHVRFDLYVEALRPPSVHLIPFDDRAARLYAQFRLDRRLSREDAIQLACASAANVDMFITNDDRLAKFKIPGVAFVSSLAGALL